jgi:hypothetical protein
VIPGIGVLQEQGSEFLVRAHELPDVVLDFKTGMNHRPKMSCSDEYQKREQIADQSRSRQAPPTVPRRKIPCQVMRVRATCLECLRGTDGG